MSEPVAGVVSRAELVRLRGDVRAAAPAQPPPDLPPGEDEPQDHVVSTTCQLTGQEQNTKQLLFIIIFISSFWY